MKSSQIRQAFLDFFASKGHTVVSSSSLVPYEDPTLLFTNAGMNQFKDCFLGLDKRAYTRAVTSQKCVRAGGKHNDLENVGYTARHHTFFEMLGNFSFGDYFKRDAINYAWEFLTSPQWLNIPKDKLSVTVYATDDEAYNIWKDEMGVPAERIIRIGDNKGAPYASDNFWAMGDTGPCGPCTEIFYDHGEHIWGGPPGSPEEDGDRFIEIWNNVFMQFNRTADGVLHPLPAPSVDTGMGLERISAVMQHVHANYEIDMFQSLLDAASKAVGCKNDGQASLKVLADHIRSCSFLIADGVAPSNEGRGYVLRRIIRRAIRHGHKLGAQEVFFYKIVAALVQEMGDAYPELKEKQAQIENTLRTEEEQFARTLDNGLKILEQDLADLQGSVIPGDVVFKLYDTFGFPMDLTADIARERNLTVDEAGFEAEMEKQRARARAAGSFELDYNKLVRIDAETEFTGYGAVDGQGKVVALLRGVEHVDVLQQGEEGVIVLDRTPFYGESGGQVGDAGHLVSPTVRVDVHNTTKSGGAFLHHAVVVHGSVKVGDVLDAHVACDIRQATALNHSATHLLHAALRKVLGTHVQQKGSLVDNQRLRFDFAQPEPVGADRLREIESLVNDEIRRNTAIETAVGDMEVAKAKGAMMLFGEKYGDSVRILSMGEGFGGDGNFSVELCGGTHAKRTGDIGLFRIVSEAGVASGVRRIEAVTGEAAIARFDEIEAELNNACAVLKTSRTGFADKVSALVEANRQLEKQVAQLKTKLASGTGGDLSAQAKDINGVKVLAALIDGADIHALRTILDQMKDKLKSAVILLATGEGDKATLIAGVTADLTTRFKAGDIIRDLAPLVGGKGGGRADMAQGGGGDVAAIPQALAALENWVSGR
ncbi:MAG TPA: alanine--tRNA ligase [Pseudomonadales bacterium]|nr:alanine--tRNA ligase [Pseudomonadales bacterium]